MTSDPIIYPSLLEARAAIVQYGTALQELQERLGIREECEDSCCATWAYARYYTEDGKIAETSY